MPDSVTLHGDAWAWADIRDAVDSCRSRSWTYAVWRPRSALVDRSGGVREYTGQAFDPVDFELVEGGWTHDHCEICWSSLHESEDSVHGAGFTADGRTWLCSECYGKLIESTS